MIQDRPRRVYQVDVFTRTPFEGNPAGVVLDAEGLSAARMQAIAREFNNSETAFVLPPAGTGHDVRLRFFTPTTEVPVCGHATIAAHYVRATQGLAATGSSNQLTGVGVQRIDIACEDGDWRIRMHQNEPTFGARLHGAPLQRLLAALRIDQDALGDGPVEIVSTGHAKLLVPLGSRAALDRLAPDLPALAAISRETGCNGYYAFALAGADADALAHGRMFAPAIGIAEDPVTGNANGPLGAYLVRYRLAPGAGHGLSAWMRQGDTMGRPGRVRVEVDVDPDHGQPAAVRIAGDAVIVFESSIRA